MAKSHAGYIGMESSRNGNGFGITVSYWRDEASILDWKRDAQHLVAQQLGKERWYTHYNVIMMDQLVVESVAVLSSRNEKFRLHEER